MGNFIVAYSGREGSSAIIDMLSWQSGLRVPVREHLDFRDYQKNFKPEELGDVLDYIFSNGTYDAKIVRGYLDQLARLPSRVARPPKRKKFEVCFKWRVHHEKGIAPVLHAHQVQILFLCRLDFLELVSSLYLSADDRSRDILGARHAQFRLPQMSAAERESYLTQLDEIAFEAKPDLFLTVANQAVKIRLALADRLSGLRDEKIEIRTVFYEDFLKSPQEFIKAILGAVGMNHAPTTFSTKYQKVMRKPAVEKILNIEILKRDSKLRGLELKYSQITSRFKPLRHPKD